MTQDSPLEGDTQRQSSEKTLHTDTDVFQSLEKTDDFFFFKQYSAFFLKKKAAHSNKTRKIKCNTQHPNVSFQVIINSLDIV